MVSSFPVIFKKQNKAWKAVSEIVVVSEECMKLVKLAGVKAIMF